MQNINIINSTKLSNYELKIVTVLVESFKKHFDTDHNFKVNFQMVSDMRNGYNIRGEYEPVGLGESYKSTFEKSFFLTVLKIMQEQYNTGVIFSEITFEVLPVSYTVSGEDELGVEVFIKSKSSVASATPITPSIFGERILQEEEFMNKKQCGCGRFAQ